MTIGQDTSSSSTGKIIHGRDVSARYNRTEHEFYIDVFIKHG